MKVLQLALAAATLAALACTALAQGPGGMMYGPSTPGGYPSYQPGMMPQGQFSGMPQGANYSAMPVQGMPQMSSYPGMQSGPAYAGGPMPAGNGTMSQAEAQQALYGPSGASPGGPLPMGAGGPMSGGDASCGDGCGPNPAQCYQDGTTHYLYGTAELFYARRNADVIKQPLVQSTDTGATLAGTGDFDYLYEPGVKLTIGGYLPCGWGIEGTYWGQMDWKTSSTVNGNNNLTLPGDLPLSTFDFFDADRMTSTYSTRVNNGELNLILPYASVQFLAGFRYLQLDERLDINSFDADTDPSGGTSDYITTTRNRLYGAQFGARTQWDLGRFGFDFQMKAGVFADAAQEQQTVGDLNNTVQLRNAASPDTTNVAFVGEVSATMLVPMGSIFTGRFGYSATWIEDVALAPDQLDFTNTATSGTTLNTRGSILIHGFNAGLEARW